MDYIFLKTGAHQLFDAGLENCGSGLSHTGKKQCGLVCKIRCQLKIEGEVEICFLMQS